MNQTSVVASLATIAVASKLDRPGPLLTHGYVLPGRAVGIPHVAAGWLLLVISISINKVLNVRYPTHTVIMAWSIYLIFSVHVLEQILL